MGIRKGGQFADPDKLLDLRALDHAVSGLACRMPGKVASDSLRYQLLPHIVVWSLE